MKNTESKEYVLGYMKGYQHAWKDYQRAVSEDLWAVHNSVDNLDPDLGKLLESAISRIEKIK